MAIDTLPLISVGIPTYNRPKGLDKCLQHITSQTYKNLEIIISDNCSSDPEVQNVIRSYASADHRIRHYRQEENRGYEQNFNFVVQQATAAYYIWVSDDDYYDSDYIEKCYYFLQQNPDYVLCSGLTKYYDKDQKFLFTEKVYPLTANSRIARIFKYFKTVGFNSMFHGVIVKSCIPQVPFIKQVGSDWVFMSSLAMQGKLGLITDTFYHRSNDGQSGSMKRTREVYKINQLTKMFFGQYTAYKIASRIFKYEPFVKKYNPVARFLLAFAIFNQINFRMVIYLLRKWGRITQTKLHK